MAKSKKALADEAYLKTETLRGQIDAFDGVQGADTTRPPIHDSGESPPPVCPHCFKAMGPLNVAGGRWTHLKRWDNDPCQLQCNDCGGAVIVSEDVWQQVRELAIATFRDRPGRYHDKRKTPKRERGAE